MACDSKKTGILDINGNDIFIGDKVKTTQPSGGILPPAESVIGIVEMYKDGDIVIRYRESHRNFDQFISLEGKINEIICAHKMMSYNVGDLTCTECGYKTINK